MQVSTQTRRRTGTGTAAGTCGELAQGVLPGGQRFHVTCPIDLGARVTVRTRPSTRTAVVGLPQAMWKTQRALRLAVELMELPALRIEVDHDSGLARTKGQASSTADMVAAVRALAAAHAVELEDDVIGALAARVEPTDGVMYEGIVAVDQHSGQLLQRWPWWPQFTVAMFSPRDERETGPGGAVAPSERAGDYADLLARLDEAAAARDAAAFAEQATRSALLNEETTPNGLLPLLLPHVDPGVGAAGLCVGHSGTVCGLLFHGAGARARAGDAVARLLPTLPAGTRGQVVHTPASPGA